MKSRLDVTKKREQLIKEPFRICLPRKHKTVREEPCFLEIYFCSFTNKKNLSKRLKLLANASDAKPDQKLHKKAIRD